MSGSASFQSVRTSWYALFALAVSRWKQLSGFNTICRVEKRRSSSSLPVAYGWAFASPPQSGLA